VALEREGRELFRAKDYEGAYEKFRDGIELIDRSDFLVDFADDRGSLSMWLRSAREQAQKAGKTLPPEPPPPDPSARQAGIRGQFFQLLSEAFTAHEDPAADPLVIYEVAPAVSDRSRADRSLGPQTFTRSRIGVSRARSALSRAEWAERYVRTSIDPGSWPSARPGPGRRTTDERRLLLRFGDHLVVQNTRSTQDKVQRVVSSFQQRPSPLQVDVAVFAASEGGTISTSRRLGAQAVPQESGLDLVVSGVLVEAATRDLSVLETKYLLPLGTAQFKLQGESATTLELTQATAEHPIHRNLAPPTLTVPDADARYGLWLDVYAEDLPHADGVRSAAVSVRARSRWPVPSVVVPKTTTLQQTRLPRFAEQVVESDRRIPHAGTLLLLGVANPFSPTGAEKPDLIVLIGVRPASAAGGPAPVPDPPRALSDTPPAEAEAPERAHYIGPLATEIVDDVTLEGWPQRPASLPVPTTALADHRASVLARLLAEEAGVWTPAATEPNPIVVREGSAYARVAPDAQERIAAAAQLLAAAESAYYAVDVVATEGTLDRVRTWTQMPGVTRLIEGQEGRYVVDDRSAASLDQAMRTNEDAASPFAARAALQARSTQKVAMRQLRLSTFVEDARPRRNADGTLRYVPVSGRAEEGLVVEVEPRWERDGRRLVHVRARAARLASIDSVSRGGAEGASVQNPTWHPTSDVSAGAPLADGDGVLLVLQAPGAPQRAIAVKVSVRRVQ
jgi:hypothetical protein